MIPASILRILVEAQGIKETHRQLDAIDRQARKTADSTDKLEKKFSNLDSSVGDFNRSMTGARNVMKLVKFPALIAGAGMAASAIGALGAGAVALGSALAPLSGLYASVATGAIALKQTQGTLKLMLMGVSTALSKQAKEFQKPTPMAKLFGKTVGKEVFPQLVKLRDIAQKNGLPELNNAVRLAAPGMAVFRPIVAGTAGAVGELAIRAAAMFSGKAWQRDIGTLGTANNKVIRDVGSAALFMATAAKDLLVAAIPLTTWLAKMANLLAGSAQNAIFAAREHGKLAIFFSHTKDVLKSLGVIVYDVGVAFFNIGKAAAPLGRGILHDVVKLANKFREWSSSMQGKATLKEYFASAKAPLYEAAGLVGDLVKAFLRLSKPNEQTTELFSHLRKIVPVLENVISTTTSALGPSLLDALTNIVRLFGALAGTSGPLTNMIKIIGWLAGGLADLLTHNAALNTMVVSMAGLYGVLKPMMIILGPVAKGFKALQLAMLGESAAADTAGISNLRARASLIATSVAMYASAAATSVAAGATVALDTALAVLTSPITLVVVAVAALVAGVILAYKHVGFFRVAVNAVWNALKTAAAAVIDFVTHIGEVPGKAVEAGKAILDGLVGGIQALPGKLADAAKWILNTARDGVVAYLGAYQSVGKWILNRIVDGFRGLVNVVTAAATWLYNKAKGGIETLLGSWSSVGKWVLSTIIAGFKIVAGGLGSVGSWLKDRITGFVQAEVGAVGHIGGWITSTIVDGIKAVGHGLGTIGTWLKDQIMGLVTSAKDGFMKIGGSIVGWLVDGLKAGGKSLQGFVNKIIDLVNNLPGVSIGHVQLFAEGGQFKDENTQGFARGGAFARTGGMVSSPITLMGEEAPRYPEFVIPTNPAYRQRARGLLNQASTAIGVNGMFMGGIFGDIWNTVKQGPSALLGALPGVSGLPDWMKGLGHYALTQVSHWIKDQLGGIFGGGSDPTPTQRIGSMVKKANEIDAKRFPYVYGGGHSPSTFDGPYDCSGLVSALLRAGGLISGAMTTDGLKTWAAGGDGKAMTVGVRGTTGPNAHTMMSLAGKYVESGGGHGARVENGWDGVFPIHRHANGLARGGLFGLPYVGKYHSGGVAPREGLAHVDKGEVMTPAGEGAVLHAVIDLGRGITERVRLEFDAQGRQQHGAWRAGALT